MGRESHNFHQFFISPSESTDELHETFNLGGILAAIIGVSCVVYVVLMCVCRGSGQKRKTKDVEGQQSSDKTDRKSVVAENGAESRSRTSVADQAAGGRTLPASDATAGHQTNSVPANARASMGRLLPAPPVSSHQTPVSSHQPPVSQLSGSPLPSSGVKHGGHISGVAPQNNQQFLSKNLLSSSASGKEMLKSDTDDYEHLGPKCTTTPSDYDILGELKSRESNSNTAPAEDYESSDDDYSEVDDKAYPEVIDVNAKRKELSVPHSKMKVEVELKEEDPYNHIGDSDGTVSTKVIQQLKQSSHNQAGDSGGSVSAALVDRLRQLREQDDPYATVQDGSAGEFKHILKAGDITQDMKSNIATGTTHHFDINKPLTKGKRDIREDYAIIHKTKEEGKLKVGDQQSSADELSPYSVSPPEPPRLYSVLDVEEDVAAADTLTQKKYKYSKVTARESLASISARRSENPYDSMTDTYENTYMLVDGSADNEMDIIYEAGDYEANGVSEISDLYAEIGISGESIQYNTSSHYENNMNIATTKAPLLNLVKPTNTQQVSRNSNQLKHNYTTSAGAAGYISNHHQDTQVYEDSAGTYATLNEKSDLLPTSADGSQAIPHLSHNQTSQGQASGSRTVQQVNDSEDYEEMGELVENKVHKKIGLLGNRVDASGEHKKVKQRRKGLNHKHQGT
ncbi:hypothetical protein BsWGS_14414 [Bradybaena similaris]